MNVAITRPSDDSRIDGELAELTDVLIKAYGKDLPDTITNITNASESGNYDLHLESDSFGNAFGACLATHGWTIVGFRKQVDSDGMRVTVTKIENCDTESTIMYSPGDESAVVFEAE